MTKDEILEVLKNANGSELTDAIVVIIKEWITSYDDMRRIVSACLDSINT
jgi:hypothetical protein